MMNARILFGIVCLLIAGCTLQNDRPQNDLQSGTTLTPVTSQRMPMVSTGTLSIGEENAPIHMLLFTNYDCAYCKEFEKTIMPGLQRDFIETGKMRISIIPLPLQKYPKSVERARMLFCGTKTGSGVFVHQQLWNDQSAFPTLATCMQDEAYLQTIESEQRKSIAALQVTLVPTYVIDGKKYTGLPSYADMRGQVEAAIQSN